MINKTAIIPILSYIKENMREDGLKNRLLSQFFESSVSLRSFLPSLTVLTVFIAAFFIIPTPVSAAEWNVQAESDRTKGITISWQGVKDADAYLILRSNQQNGSFTELVRTSDKTYIDTDIKRNKPYYYIVKAYSVENKLGTLLAESGVRKAAITLLEQPQITGITPSPAGNVITWEKVSEAYDYGVYRKASATDKWTFLSSCAKLTFTDSKAEKNAVYSYAILPRLSDRDFYGKLSEEKRVKSHNSDNQWAFFLVNADNLLPDSYVPKLEKVQSRYLMDTRCADYARKMLSAGESAGLKLQVVSAYRSFEQQQKTLNYQINYYLRKGYSYNAAINRTREEVQLPRASEHNAAIAIDIVNDSWFQTHDDLTPDFANTKEHKWLAENAHKYGFIIRYPEGKQDITGIYYEPWHFRFVGVDMAERIYKSGLCLEEFMIMLDLERQLQELFEKFDTTKLSLTTQKTTKTTDKTTQKSTGKTSADTAKTKTAANIKGAINTAPVPAFTAFDLFNTGTASGNGEVIDALVSDIAAAASKAAMLTSKYQTYQQETPKEEFIDFSVLKRNLLYIPHYHKTLIVARE